MNDDWKTQDNTDYAPWVSIHGLTAPYGQCQCGCRQTATIAKVTNTEWGHRAGQPTRFLRGHNHSYGQTLEASFWARANQGAPTECWLWGGYITEGGYGVLTYKGKWCKAHRVSYEIHNGPICMEMLVCHTCDANYLPGDTSYRRCVNPTHLFAGTNKDNSTDAKEKNRIAHGERSARARLAAVDIPVIRALRVEGLRMRVIAERFGVAKSTIQGVLEGKTWRRIP